MKFSALRKRLHVSPTTVIATLALVFAMTGGAYAAKKYLITSTKQISPSVLKTLQGKAGPAGANGAAGAQGPAGPQGPQGPGGSLGAKGETGPEGKQGPQGIPGEKGLKGEKGANGQPWTPESQLPEKATETGTWSFGPTISNGTFAWESLASFTVKLKEPLTSEHVHFVTREEVENHSAPSQCLGNLEEPSAASGNLCLYEGALESVTLLSLNSLGGEVEGGAGRAGVMGLFEFGAGPSSGRGVWAVTG
jgi:hypothetical protein